MINETIKRIEKRFDYENIFIIVNERQLEVANRYVDFNIPRQNIISEPKAKNTAMSIFYATLKIKKLKGNGVITVLSSDHYIEEKDKLLKNIEDGIKLATNTNNLVILGIQPSYPATGFGYIKYCEDYINNCNSVIEFKEKPNYEMAVKYFQSTEYVWNSGMFIWKINLILKEFKKYLPNIYSLKQNIYNIINTDKEDEIMKKIYNNIEAISIDKGILEKANNIKMIKADFNWMDIGTINDYFKIYPKDNNGNTIIGDLTISEKTINTNILNKSDELLVTIGIKNINIIKDNSVCVICNQKDTIELQQIAKNLKKENKYRSFL